ncbi:MAG: MFS transporter [Candidatus Binatia bacterium]
MLGACSSAADTVIPSPHAPVPAKRVATLLCSAHVLSMTGFGTVSALLPLLMATWRISNSEAGAISGMYYAGYMVAVPLLTGMTDRVDARRVYLLACALSSTAALAFAILADGFWSALMLQGLAGAGLAGTYMPGLKILSDHIEGPRQSRWVAVYTSTFGIGAALSLSMAGAITAMFEWRWAFAAAGVGPAAAGLLVFLRLPPPHPRPTVGNTARLLDCRSVFRNRAATGYILGYAAHCWELFGFRSWIVAFFAFAGAIRSTAEPMMASAATLAAAINLIGPAASILGNEIAARFGRPRVVLAIMSLSAALACVVGFSARLPGAFVFALACVYFLAIMGDSAALTAGLLASAAPQQRGAAMAVHSFLGFGAAFVAPVVFGAVLDFAGGNRSVFAWGVAFASLGIGGALAPLTLAMYRRRERRRGQHAPH